MLFWDTGASEEVSATPKGAGRSLDNLYPGKSFLNLPRAELLMMTVTSATPASGSTDTSCTVASVCSQLSRETGRDITRLFAYTCTYIETPLAGQGTGIG